MIVKREIYSSNYRELQDMLCDSARDNLKIIYNNKKFLDFINLIDELYVDIDIMDLNDILRFDFVWVCEKLNIQIK